MDSTRNFKLKIEPIPSQNWGVSLARMLPSEVWDSLRREVYSIADYTCVICGATDKRLHCHERWEYNDKRHVQRLAGLECICGDCHQVKHWGRTSKLLLDKGDKWEADRLIAHFCKVNGCTREEFNSHKIRVGILVQRRSKEKYKVNFGLLKPEEVELAWRKLRGLE